MNSIWSMTHRSQEISTYPRFKEVPGALELWYDYETEDGTYADEAMTFVEAVSYRHTVFPQCTHEQVSAYDEVVELDPDNWLVPMRDRPEGIRMFRIFLDDWGSYEVLAKRFVPPPDSMTGGR